MTRTVGTKSCKVELGTDGSITVVFFPRPLKDTFDQPDSAGGDLGLPFEGDSFKRLILNPGDHCGAKLVEPGATAAMLPDQFGEDGHRREHGGHPKRRSLVRLADQLGHFLIAGWHRSALRGFRHLIRLVRSASR